MKKINFSIVTLLAVALMFVFASCTKEGVYKPKKKISKIYETVQTDPNPEKILKEIWTWNGKLLSKVEYEDGDFVTFSYDKNRLTTINSDFGRTELEYDGKFIDEMKYYSGNDLYMTIEFDHEKNLISGYTVEYEGTDADKAKIARLIENSFRFIAPEVAQDEAAEYLKATAGDTKGSVKRTVTYTYDGKNVIEKTDRYGNNTVVYTYTYTDYKNPFYGLLSEMEISKNAPATCVRTMTDMPKYEYDYTYKADGKVPTQVTENLTWSLTVGSMTTTHTETRVTDYEYMK